MLTENVLTDFEMERRQKKAFYLILLLFLLATIVNCIFYVFPNFLKYPFQFHLKSFNSYFSFIIRIIFPMAGIVWFFQKKKEGWTILTFLTIFGISHTIFWAVRLLVMGGSLILILQQVMTIILGILIATLYFLVKKEILEGYKITDQHRIYTLISGVILAILFNLKIIFIG